MENLEIKEIPEQKIYKDREIWVGTFLGGPLVSGYMIAENFKVFNDGEKTKKTWIITIVATIVIFTIAFFIPDNIRPNQIIPLIYTSVAYFLIQHFQGKDIKEHLNSGGQIFSWWRTIGISLIGLVLTTIPLLGYGIISDNIDNAKYTTKTYGVMKHEIAFEKGNIDEEEVNNIANILTITTFFDNEVTKYVYVKKEKNTYEISISVLKGIENNPEAVQIFVDLRTEVQKLIPNKKIIFKLAVDNWFDVVKQIE